ncbi:MAG: phosphatase PAP2 family protein [Chloroflexota bacterium]
MADPITIIVRQIQEGDGVLIAVLILFAVFALSRLLVFTGHLTRQSGLDKFGIATWNIGSLLGLEQAYEITRGQIPHETDIALLHAYRLLDFEWGHGFFIEQRVEHFFLQFHLLMSAIDLYYVICHVAITIGVLVWVYFRHRDKWTFVRNLLMLVTAIALVAFYLYPTAPPRMLWNYGFVDPLISNHLEGAGGAQVNSFTYNPYAAMPSIHVGYALVMGWAVWISRPSLVPRILACLYPVSMAAAVIISANHFVLDVVGALLTVLLARVVLFGFSQITVTVPTLFSRTAT